MPNSPSDTWGKMFWALALIFAFALVLAFVVMLVLHKTVSAMAVPYLAFTVPQAVFLFVAKALRAWEENGATPRRLAFVWTLSLAAFMFAILGATFYAGLAFHLIAREDVIGAFAVAAVGGTIATTLVGYPQVLKTAGERAARRADNARSS